jgi:hypothetical protein
MTYLALALCIALTLLQAFDFYSTYVILNRPGGSEDNPVMAKLFAAVGMVPGLVLAKGGSVAFIWWAWYHNGWTEEWQGLPIPLVMLGVLTLYYANVMAKNHDFLTRR